ncbi:MAG: P-II family nitrogen regulator [Verrucomicrobiae bacterium]|nr:P-II family nitrogen regulator [Verrucomicrobiae bacterium]
MVEHVIDAIQALDDPPGLSLSDSRGLGHTEKPEPPHRFLERVKLEIVVPDDRAEEIVKIIAANARTSYHGDGLIFVSDVERVVRIRNGSEGVDVLS